MRGKLLRTLALSASLVSATLFACQARAEDPLEGPAPDNSPDPILQQQLDAGEFAPAFETAMQQSSPIARDRLLGRIALAQVQAGSRVAAVNTAASIEDDMARTEALRGFDDVGNAGGGAQPDFETLITLITSTVAPDSWVDVGGPGDVEAFAGGIVIDTDGFMQRVEPPASSIQLTSLRKAAQLQQEDNPRPENAVRHASPLRKVSLTRLERAVQLRHALGQEPTEAMATLAGLRRVRYVLIYPESRDLVLAGEAGDWTTNHQGRRVDTDGGKPVLNLDDLVVVWRHVLNQRESRFGCSITPREKSLAAAQSYLEASGNRPLSRGRRKGWLEETRRLVGRQDISVFGIDASTHAGILLVEADYHMKRIGIGLEEGILGVPSYLEMIEPDSGEEPRPMSVMRWWFALRNPRLTMSPRQDAFALEGCSVRVLGENELLTDTGQRVHTGTRDELNEKFAHNFTEHFERLAEKYSLYGELRNICDLAIVAALVKQYDVRQQLEWPMCHFADPLAYRVAQHAAPKEVETVANLRKVNKTHIVGVVSGGVDVTPEKLLAKYAPKLDRDHRLESQLDRGEPRPQLSRDVWWWD
jgi:hypothetical protein